MFETLIRVQRWYYWPFLFLVLFLLRGLYRKFLHPLRPVPGPALAPITNLWRLRVFLRGQQHHEYYDMHQKYGPLVRLGPNTVMLNDAAHFNEYFALDKSDWWLAFRIRKRQDETDHGNILEMKPHIAAKRQVMA